MGFPRAQVPQGGGINSALINLANRSNPQMVSQLRGMSNQQIEQLGHQMMQNDPRFAAFVQLCQGTSLGQVARQYGINV